VKRKISKHEGATIAVQTAWRALYEAGMLRDLTNFIGQTHDGKCEWADDQIQVLNNVTSERLNLAFDGLSMVKDYFQKRVKKNDEGKVREVDALRRKSDVDISRKKMKSDLQLTAGV
jgi:methionyl-tRNA synthetase